MEQVANIPSLMATVHHSQRHKNSSKLNFGSDAIVLGPRTVSTPLVPKILDTFYFLTLDVMPRTQKGSKHEKNI